MKRIGAGAFLTARGSGIPIESPGRANVGRSQRSRQRESRCTGAREQSPEVIAAVARLAEADMADFAACLPHLTDKDVIALAKSLKTREGVITAICAERALTRSDNVKLALITNPNTPFPLVARWLPLLRSQDLKELASRGRSRRGGGPGGGSAPAALARAR